MAPSSSGWELPRIGPYMKVNKIGTTGTLTSAGKDWRARYD